LGFEVVRFSSADPFPEYEKTVKDRIQAGLYPTELMSHEKILENVETYADPSNSLSGAKSIISMAFCYFTDENPDLTRPGEPHGVLARVNQKNISHETHRRQDKFAELLRKKGVKVAKTSRVPYKMAAVRAGVGWQGKNSLIITEEFGSWVSLRSLVVNTEFEPDTPSAQNCGTCQACQRACPTAAIQSPGVINGNKCLDYVTGKTGVIHRELRYGMENRLVSCDRCHEVCPHNQHVKPVTKEIAYFSPELNHSPALIPLLNISEEKFRRDFAFHGFIDLRSEYLKRNVIIALGNIGDPIAVPVLKNLLKRETPLLKRHVAWALGQINSKKAHKTLKDALSQEKDLAVREEMLYALDNN